MKIMSTEIEGLFVVETNPNTDYRGSFARLFCKQDLALAIGERHIVQINQSRTKKAGMVRGIHFQYPPHAEMKLVRCIKGRLWDLVVDLRAGSPTLLRWHAEELSPQNARMMIIPEGFAHAYYSFSSLNIIYYKLSNYYHPEYEDGIIWNDKSLKNKWPTKTPVVSAKDKKLKTFLSFKKIYKGL